MTSTQIRCFLAAVHADSFSQAAQVLYMSQPTFGRQIAALEQELGFSLFHRTARALTLTPAGEVFLARIEPLVSSFNEAVSEARRVSLGESAVLKVGLLEGQLLDPDTSRLLHEFETAYPDIEVELSRFSFHSMLNALQEGSIHFGITLTIEVAHSKQFDHFELFTVPNELVLPRGHRLAGKGGLTLADFAQETFIEVTEDESGIVSSLMQRSCREAGFEPSLRRVPDLRSQILNVESGNGIAAFNLYHMACNHPNLCHVSLPEFRRASFSAAWVRSNIPPELRLFLQLLQKIHPQVQEL